MHQFALSKLVKRTVFPLIVVAGAGLSSAASAVMVNFDTRQDGTPYVGLGDSFPSNEYNGVTINDSDPTPGSTYVNQINPVNVGTDISGYYVNVGAFEGVQTQLILDFTPVITDVSFDFATPSGDLKVSTFDASGASLGVFNFLGTNLFVNQAGFDENAGHVDLSGIGNIAQLLIEPNMNEALIVDNLNFSPVPVPASLWLFGSGLLGLLGMSRKRAV